MKSIVVASATHSGSTILVRWLSQLKGAIAVGEANNVFRNKPLNKNPQVANCSCGKPMGECELWGQGIKNRKILNEKLDEMGFSIVIDSSKPWFKGDYIVFVYKDINRLWRSAKKIEHPTIKTFFRLIKNTLKVWLQVYFSNRPKIVISFSEFLKNPHKLLLDVADMVSTEVDYKECSHIAYGNTSKYKPLKIY